MVFFFLSLMEVPLARFCGCRNQGYYRMTFVSLFEGSLSSLSKGKELFVDRIAQASQSIQPRFNVFLNLNTRKLSNGMLLFTPPRGDGMSKEREYRGGRPYLPNRTFSHYSPFPESLLSRFKIPCDHRTQRRGINQSL